MIVVIAILATISIVAYNGIQDRAIASTVKSDLANFAKKIELAKVDTVDGKYPGFNDLTANMGITATKSAYKLDRYNWYYCTSSDGVSYSFGVIDKNNNTYFQSSANGIEQGTPGNMDSTTNCAKVGEAANNVAGYNWNGTTSTGSWRSWVN